jgi:hypothetical protein
MSDIFISYARPDQALAQSLADDLKARGFRVWWDTELLGSDDYYEVIYAALSNAMAAVVIWSKNSCHSRYVRDEARFALQKEKLIATRAADFNVDDIPFGFQGQHTEDVNQRDRIVRAIERLGVKPLTEPLPTDEAAAWDKVKDTKDPDRLIEYLAQYPSSPHKAQAFQLAQALFNEGVTSSKPEIAGLRTSAIGAFFQGMTFRIPVFQFKSQSVWSSIGLGIGIFLLYQIIGGIALGGGLVAHALTQLAQNRYLSTGESRT